jgi:hypothetical protein
MIVVVHVPIQAFHLSLDDRTDELNTHPWH